MSDGNDLASLAVLSDKVPPMTLDAAPDAALQAELVRLLGRRTGSDGRHETAIPELRLYRFSQPTEPTYLLQEPAVYVVIQGRKQVRSVMRSMSTTRLGTSRRRPVQAFFGSDAVYGAGGMSRRERPIVDSYLPRNDSTSLVGS